MAPEQFRARPGRRARRRLRARLRALRRADRRAAVPARDRAGDDARPHARRAAAGVGHAGRAARVRPRARPRAGQGAGGPLTRRRATSGARRWPPPRGARSPRRSARSRAARPRRDRARAGREPPRPPPGRSATRRCKRYRSRPRPAVGVRSAPSARARRGRAIASCCSPDGGDAAAARRPLSSEPRSSGWPARSPRAYATRTPARMSRLLTSDAQRVSPARPPERPRRRRRRLPGASSPATSTTGFELGDLEAAGGARGPRDRALPGHLRGRRDTTGTMTWDVIRERGKPQIVADHGAAELTATISQVAQQSRATTTSTFAPGSTSSPAPGLSGAHLVVAGDAAGPGSCRRASPAA